MKKRVLDDLEMLSGCSLGCRQTPKVAAPVLQGLVHPRQTFVRLPICDSDGGVPPIRQQGGAVFSGGSGAWMIPLLGQWALQLVENQLAMLLEYAQRRFERSHSSPPFLQ